MCRWCGFGGGDESEGEGKVGVSYSSSLKVTRSFRSAPAQKALSCSLARISARVAPFSPSCAIDWISRLSSLSSCTEMALRACGRFRERILMFPACGAGTDVIFKVDDGVL